MCHFERDILISLVFVKWKENSLLIVATCDIVKVTHEQSYLKTQKFLYLIIVQCLENDILSNIRNKKVKEAIAKAVQRQLLNILLFYGWYCLIPMGIPKEWWITYNGKL